MKIKLFNSFIVFLFIIIPIFSVSAHATGEETSVTSENEDFVFEATQEGLTLTNYLGSAQTVTVPQISNGANVTSISNGAFAFNISVKSITVPSTVTYIEKGSFDGCSSLTEINVDKSNTVYSSVNGCLYDKTGKILFTVPAGVSGVFEIPKGVETVNEKAFGFCTKITSVNISSTVKTVGEGAFDRCMSLDSFTCSDSLYFSASDGYLLDKVGKKLILCPPKTAETLILPDFITEIADYAFYSNTTLSALTVPASVTKISDKAFCNSVSISKYTVEEDNLNYTSIDGILYNKDKTVLVSAPNTTSGPFAVPDGVVEINNYAFYGCNISNVYFPFTLDKIGDSAFSKNSLLSIVILPPHVEYIGESAFDECGAKVAVSDEIQTVRNNACSAILCNPATVIDNQNIVIEYISYIYNEKNGVISISNDVSLSRASVELKNSICLVNGKSANKYTVFFTLDGEKYVPDFAATVLIKNGEFFDNSEIYVLNGENTELYSYTYKDAVSLYTSGGDFYVFSDEIMVDPILEISTLPSKLEYKMFEKLNTEGLQLNYYDEFGVMRIVNNGYSIEYSFDSLGENTVYVNYAGLTVTFNVNVTEAVLAGKVTITGAPELGGSLKANITELSYTEIPYVVSWLRDGTPIASQNGMTYSVTSEDIDKNISVRIKADGGFSGEFASESVYIEIPQISSVVYAINSSSMTVSTVSAMTKVSSFIEGFDHPEFLRVMDGEIQADDEDYVSTSMTLQLVFGDNVYRTLTVIVTGDINGDGKISITDFVNFKTYMLGNAEFSDIISCAADINGDGKLTITDFVQLKSHLLGKMSIVPKSY